tara:strand:- start:807 stop:1319 length:513 start_codon:yes stop_codon:yes gene_type:complete
MDIPSDLAHFLLEPEHELWDRVTVRQDFQGTAHSKTRTVFFRGPARPEWDCVPSVDTYGADALQDIYADLLADVYNLLPIKELGRVMLVELAPGGEIREHTDEGAYAEHFDRFHIAITNSPKSSLTVGGEEKSFGQGECWWFNHRLPHSAANLDRSRRVHLIFDAVLRNV